MEVGNVSKSRATTKKGEMRMAEFPPSNQMHANGRRRAHSPALSGRMCRISLSTSALPSSPFLNSPVLELVPPRGRVPTSSLRWPSLSSMRGPLPLTISSPPPEAAERNRSAAEADTEKREDTAAKKRHVEEDAAEKNKVTPETAANRLSDYS